jgi:ferredoxin
MKLTADAVRCMGHGRCYASAPELLTYDDDGYVTVRGEVIDVPEAQFAAAREAAANCPEQAIELSDDE